MAADHSLPENGTVLRSARCMYISCKRAKKGSTSFSFLNSRSKTTDKIYPVSFLNVRQNATPSHHFAWTAADMDYTTAARGQAIWLSLVAIQCISAKCVHIFPLAITH